MPRVRWWPILIVLVLWPTSAHAEDAEPYPSGRSTQRIEGLKTVLVRPEGEAAAEVRSLVVALHAAASPAANMADAFKAWTEHGYVVCAPEARDLTWEVGDLESVIRIIPHLVEALALDPKRVHLVGYSDGGTHLDRVAFDDDVKPCSATWVAATYNGNRVPRWARDSLGALVLIGQKDEQIRSLRAGADRLRGKVRSIELRAAEGVGHRFPYDERPYLLWWMGVQEGRITPGDDLGFDWTEDLPAAIASQEGKSKGGLLVWIYAAEDSEQDAAMTLQAEVLLDANVRFLGRQLACVKLDLAKSKELLAPFGVETSPALLVLDTKGEVEKLFQDEFSARKVASVLKKLAPERKPR